MTDPEDNGAILTAVTAARDYEYAKGRASRQPEVDDLTAQLAAAREEYAVHMADVHPEPEPDPEPEPEPDPEPSTLPYTADSYFRTPAPADTDTERTAAFRAFMASHVDQKDTAYPLIRGVGGNKWGTVWAVGKEADPVWKFTGTPPNSKVAHLADTGFHAPEWLGDILTGTSDSPFGVRDDANGFTVFGTKASVAGTHLIGTTRGSWGCTWHTSNGLDARNPLSDDARNFTSRGRISDSMVITREHVDAANAAGTGLGYVLHLFIAESNTEDGYRHPMTGAESGKYGFGAEGERIRIDPAVDLTTRGLSPFGLAIARTLQDHGAYIGDNAGSASGLKAEQTGPGHDPWTGLDVSVRALKGLTWADFVVCTS